VGTMDATLITHHKQPAEVRTFGIDFGPALVPDRSLIACSQPTATVKRQPPGGGATASDLNFGPIVLGGNVAQMQIGGGTDGATYKLEWIGTDDGGDRIMTVGLLAVRDK
jgi:hypothetical protein